MNKENISKVHIGLADFSEPTLLIIGDAAALRWLADGFASQQLIDLSGSSLLMLHGISLFFELADKSEIIQIEKDIRLRVSLLESIKFAGVLQALAASNAPAHAYLDLAENNAGINVIASKDEYNADEVFI